MLVWRDFDSYNGEMICKHHYYSCVCFWLQALADEFLESSLSLDSFLEQFLSLRSLAHKRRVRIEKLQEILRQRSEGNPTTMTSSTGISQDAPSTASPWNQQTSIATTSNQQQPSSQPQSSTYQNASQPASSSTGGSSGLPYSPYPVSSPNPLPAAAAAAAAGSGPANPPSQFSPYPGSGSPFTPAGSLPSTRPAFGPPAPATCPYPTQPAFPAPYPGSAFGQYTPRNPQCAPAPYPSSYSYGGYSYPAGSAFSSSQSPTGRPICRPGYGVSQPYSWKHYCSSVSIVLLNSSLPFLLSDHFHLSPSPSHPNSFLFPVTLILYPPLVILYVYFLPDSRCLALLIFAALFLSFSKYQSVALSIFPYFSLSLSPLSMCTNTPTLVSGCCVVLKC